MDFKSSQNQIVNPDKTVFAFTLGGILQKQLSNIQANVPKGYTIIMNKTSELHRITAYVNTLQTTVGDKDVYLVNDMMRFLTPNERVLCLVAQDKWITTGRRHGYIYGPDGIVRQDVNYSTGGDEIDSVYIFLAKDGKFSVYCIYDRDGKEVGKIVDKF